MSITGFYNIRIALHAPFHETTDTTKASSCIIAERRPQVYADAFTSFNEDKTDVLILPNK